MIICNKCGRVGDAQEFVYFIGRTDEFKFVLQCMKCGSHDCSKQTIKNHITENNLLSGDSEGNYGDNKSMWGTYEMCQELKRAKRREEYL